MNAAVTITSAIDWSKFDLEGWLYQFHAWSNGNTESIIKMIKVDTKKLKPEEREELLAELFKMQEVSRTKRKGVACKIDDNEARAVQRLILDMMGNSEILDQWMRAIIMRYFSRMSWPEMVTPQRTQMDARFDVKCGLAALHSRYQFIVYKK